MSAINNVETVQNAQNIQSAETSQFAQNEAIRKFFKQTYDSFQKNETLLKKKILEDLPKYLNKPGTTKAKIVEHWPENVTETDFLKLITTQTEGAEYHSFDYFVMKYDLKFDDNKMIVFTDEFPFDRKIKKEALFIWGILNSINHHKHLGNFIKEILYGLQISYESEHVNANRRMKYDLGFPVLQIAVEIDENHAAKEIKYNDLIKTATMQLNGLCLARLDFQKIYDGNIPKDGNANVELLNSEYYGIFLNDLHEKVTNSLLQHSIEFREYFIMNMFKKSLISYWNESFAIIQNNLAKKENSTNLVDIKKINKTLSLNYSAFTKIDEIVKSTNKDSDFTRLFKMKDYYKNLGKTAESNVIEYDKLIELMQIKPENKEEFKEFICSIGIIADENITDNEILVSWRQINTIITSYENNISLKKSLIFYYIELEKSYEIIVQRIGAYHRTVQGTTESYNLCMDHMYKKSESIYKNKETKLQKTISDLDLKYLDIKSNNECCVAQIKEFEKELSIIHKAYNKILNGELSPTRCYANIKYNQKHGIQYIFPKKEIDFSKYDITKSLSVEDLEKINESIKAVELEKNSGNMSSLVNAIEELDVESDIEEFSIGSEQESSDSN